MDREEVATVLGYFDTIASRPKLLKDADEILARLEHVEKHGCFNEQEKLWFKKVQESWASLDKAEPSKPAVQTPPPPLPTPAPALKKPAPEPHYDDFFDSL